MSDAVWLSLQGAAGSLQGEVKMAGLNPAEPTEPGALSTGEVRGMRGVTVKFIDITQNPDCGGSVPAGH